jgi:NADH/NAD ratio-sensing transcriptional regulator Rex
VHGRELSKSELLTSDNVDVVILLTRSATQELIEKLKQKGIKNIIEFSKLINEI